MAQEQSIAAGIRKQAVRLLTEGQYLGRFDQIRARNFYSSALLAPGAGGVIAPQKIEVFKALAGDIGQGYAGPLTERETNWLQSGRTPDQQNLLVKAWGVAVRRGPTPNPNNSPPIYPVPLGVGPGLVDVFVPPHPTDVYNAAQRITLNIKWLTNEVPQGILADFPAVGGLIGFDQQSRQFPDASAQPGVSGTATSEAASRAKLPIARNTTVAAFERRKEIPEFLEHGKQFSVVLEVIEPITLLANPPGADATPQLNDASGALELVVYFWAVESFVEKS